MRRLVELDASASELRRYVDQRIELIEGEPEWSTIAAWLEAIEALLAQHAGQLRAGMDDGVELLPAEHHGILISERLHQADAQLDTEEQRLSKALEQLQGQRDAQEAQQQLHSERIEHRQKERENLASKFAKVS